MGLAALPSGVKPGKPVQVDQVGEGGPGEAPRGILYRPAAQGGKSLACLQALELPLKVIPAFLTC